MKIRELKEKIDQRLQYLKQELSSIRTGRATGSLVEEIRVDAYEGFAPLSLKELATISISDATTISIKPWDLSILPKIEKAVRGAPGGLNPVTYDDTIRVSLPPLSLERRQELAKVVSGKVEEAKVEVRRIRQDEMRSLDEMEKNGVISQDERFKQREEVGKIIKEKTLEIERIGKEKEDELLRV